MFDEICGEYERLDTNRKREGNAYEKEDISKHTFICNDFFSSASNNGICRK